MIDATCPVCGQRIQGQLSSDWPQLPFCSQKCKTIDLGRWLSAVYTIPAEEPVDDEEAEDLE